MLGAIKLLAQILLRTLAFTLSQLSRGAMSKGLLVLRRDVVLDNRSPGKPVKTFFVALYQLRAVNMYVNLVRKRSKVNLLIFIPSLNNLKNHI